MEFCGCPAAWRYVSYKPSDGGSLPLEPDWARLMYKFNSFSYGQKQTVDRHVNASLEITMNLKGV